jgi:hypothetical protein
MAWRLRVAAAQLGPVHLCAFQKHRRIDHQARITGKCAVVAPPTEHLWQR